jgi:fructokinase
MMSRVGDDELGREIRRELSSRALRDSFVQRDPVHPTGTVSVALDFRGQPSYTITPEVAYDYLTWDDALAQLFREARAVCFGTLIQRHPTARATVQRALREAAEAIVVYDINLRQHFYSKETIEASLHASRWVKLNDGELAVLTELLDLPGEPSAGLQRLRERYQLELACMTRGEHGCLVQTAKDEVDVTGIPVKVVDTVGAGDAFTAGLLVMTLEGRPLRESATLANRLAARVAASAGGTPVICRVDIEVG